MDLMGFTLNTMSLLALGLVAGVLVDDAIVEIENIVRHIRMGKSAYQASIDAADEIGLAVVATTFSIVAVFLPVGLMPGISGQFFMNFGLTVVVAVLMSLAVARMITPMIAAYFMKAEGEADHASGPMMDRYITMLKWSLHNRGKMMMVVFCVACRNNCDVLRDSRAAVSERQCGFFGSEYKHGSRHHIGTDRRSDRAGGQNTRRPARGRGCVATDQRRQFAHFHGAERGSRGHQPGI